MPQFEPSDNSRAATSIRLSTIRAMSFKQPESVAGQPQANTAVHVQSVGGETSHAIAEILITRDKAGTFPTQIWPVAEALCRHLSETSIPVASVHAVLGNAVREICETLEQDGQDELANSLRAANTRKSWNRLLSPFLWALGARLRRRLSNEEALRRLLGAFGAALTKLAGAAETDRADFAITTDIEDFYEQRIDAVERSFCFPEPPLPCLEGRPANVYGDAAFVRNHPKDATKGHLVEREALAFGLAVLRFPNGSFIATDRAGARLSFKWSRSPASSGVSLALCNHKEATRTLLARCGLPVTPGRVFSSEDHDRIAAYAEHIGYPVVCKPAAGVRGIGVVTDIRNRDELDRALQLYKKSALGSDDLLVEQYVPGDDYRIVVVGDKVVSAVCRKTASIVGTGDHSVADLILHKNRLRASNPHLRLRLIQYDDAARYQLERAGLTLASVPEKGRWVYLANSNNISRGGDSIEVLDELHPSISRVAVQAVQAVPGLGFCGLDLILQDHTKPIGEQAAAIIELNAHGAIGTGQYPMWGTPRDVARELFLHCANKVGVELSPTPAAELCVKIRVRGRVTRVGYRRWLRKRASAFGVACDVVNEDQWTVVATLQGATAPVAALANAAVRGPRRAIPFWVAVEHVESVNPSEYPVEAPA